MISNLNVKAVVKERNVIDMKKTIKQITDFAFEIITLYSVFFAVLMALVVGFAIPQIGLPLLILALAFKVIPMVSKKKDGGEK